MKSTSWRMVLKKKLAQIDLDYRKELDAIKKQRKDWETEQGGKLTDKQEEKLGTWASNAAKKRESDIDSTSKAKLEADKKAWQEYFIRVRQLPGKAQKSYSEVQ